MHSFIHKDGERAEGFSMCSEKKATCHGEEKREEVGGGGCTLRSESAMGQSRRGKMKKRRNRASSGCG